MGGFSPWPLPGRTADARLFTYFEAWLRCVALETCDPEDATHWDNPAPNLRHSIRSAMTVTVALAPPWALMCSAVCTRAELQVSDPALRGHGPTTNPQAWPAWYRPPAALYAAGDQPHGDQADAFLTWQDTTTVPPEPFSSWLAALYAGPSNQREQLVIYPCWASQLLSSFLFRPFLDLQPPPSRISREDYPGKYPGARARPPRT